MAAIVYGEDKNIGSTNEDGYQIRSFFRYYENNGVLVGSHYPMIEENPVGNETPKRYLGEPVYPYKGEWINLVDNRLISSPKVVPNESKSSFTNGCSLVLRYFLKDATFGASMNINDRIYDLYIEGTKSPSDEYIDIKFGTFHLLTNTPKAIYRSNISYDLEMDAINTGVVNPIDTAPDLYIDGAKTIDGAFQAQVLGMTPSGIPGGDPNYNAFTFFNKKKILKLADNDTAGKELEFIEYYLDVTRVDESHRPDFMSDYNLDLALPNMLEAGGSLTWDAIRGDCYTSIRIYDGYDISRNLSEYDLSTGHYICRTRARVNLEKLKKWSYNNSARIRGVTYPYPTSTAFDTIKFNLILHPPVYNLFPSDSITKLLYPVSSMFNQRVDRIKFVLPRNYKSDGNIQLGITFFDDNGNPFFTDLFDQTVYSSPELRDLVSSPVDGVWSFTITGDKYEKNGKFFPTFNNDYLILRGVHPKQSLIVKYTLSTDLYNAIKDFKQTSFRIHFFDGTTNLGSDHFSNITNPDNSWS